MTKLPRVRAYLHWYEKIAQAVLAEEEAPEQGGPELVWDKGLGIVWQWTDGDWLPLKAAFFWSCGPCSLATGEGPLCPRCKGPMDSSCSVALFAPTMAATAEFLTLLLYHTDVSSVVLRGLIEAKGIDWEITKAIGLKLGFYDPEHERWHLPSGHPLRDRR